MRLGFLRLSLRSDFAFLFKATCSRFLAFSSALSRASASAIRFSLFFFWSSWSNAFPSTCDPLSMRKARESRIFSSSFFLATMWLLVPGRPLGNAPRLLTSRLRYFCWLSCTNCSSSLKKRICLSRSAVTRRSISSCGCCPLPSNSSRSSKTRLSTCLSR